MKSFGSCVHLFRPKILNDKTLDTDTAIRIR